MNHQTKQSLLQFEKLAGKEKHDPRQKFMRVKEVINIYHVSRPTLMKMAIDAGALYNSRINSYVCLFALK